MPIGITISLLKNINHDTEDEQNKKIMNVRPETMKIVIGNAKVWHSSGLS